MLILLLCIIKTVNQRQILLLGLGFACALNVQAQQQQSFDAVDLTKFVKVFFAEKQAKPNVDVEIQHVLDSLNISEREFKSLMFDESPITDSRSDRKAEMILALEKVEQKIQRAEVEIRVKLCKEKDLAVDVYERILKRYREDIKFQQELRPFFNAYFQKERH